MNEIKQIIKDSVSNIIEEWEKINKENLNERKDMIKPLTDEIRKNLREKKINIQVKPDKHISDYTGDISKVGHPTFRPVDITLFEEGRHRINFIEIVSQNLGDKHYNKTDKCTKKYQLVLDIDKFIWKLDKLTWKEEYKKYEFDNYFFIWYSKKRSISEMEDCIKKELNYYWDSEEKENIKWKEKVQKTHKEHGFKKISLMLYSSNEKKKGLRLYKLGLNKEGFYLK